MVVYQIRNLKNGFVYIGSTKQYTIRRKQHIESLKSKTHHNRHLQREFNKYGEANFVFEILEKGFKSYELMVATEYIYINSTSKRYNILTEDIYALSYGSQKTTSNIFVGKSRVIITKKDGIKRTVSRKQKKIRKDLRKLDESVKDRIKASVGVVNYKRKTVNGEVINISKNLKQ